MINAFPSEILELAAREQEVGIITEGRVSGRPHRVTIWITTDGERLFVRSGGGLERDWPRNVLRTGRARLRLGDRELAVRARLVEDADLARRVSGYVVSKYNFGGASAPGEPLTRAESATFELLPDGLS